MNEETSDPLQELRALRQAKEELTRALGEYQALARSAGWDRQVKDGEETISGLLNGILNPEYSLEGVISLLFQVGELRGVKKVYANVETKIEMMQIDLEDIVAEITSMESAIDEDNF